MITGISWTQLCR